MSEFKNSMEEVKNKLLSRLSALVFGTVFLGVISLIALTFFVPTPTINTKEQIIDYPIVRVWEAIHKKNYYLQSKPQISKYKIYDTILPSWTEYYTPSDSTENKTKSIVLYKKLTYAIINAKHQQINTISFHLDSISPNQTKVKIYELSKYFNVWGAVYFQLFHPNTVIDYEFIKLKNTLEYQSGTLKQ